jgi:hypothetical protein
MDDKTLLQNLINEIKNLNSKAASDSKILRDSLSQDTLISKGITDLNKQFEKSSKENKQTLDDSKDILEQIRDEIKNNSDGNTRGTSITNIANLQNLSSIFFKMVDSTKNLININKKLNKNIKELIESNNGLRGFNITQPNPNILNNRTQSQTTATTTNTETKSSKTPLENYNDSIKMLGSFISAINNIKVIPALKASFFLPIIIGNMIKAMKKFDEGDFFGKLRQISEKTKIGKKTFSKTFDYSSNLFESMQKLTESLKTIQDMKMAKTWVQVKLLSMFIIPSMIKAINMFEKVSNGTSKKIERIGESIGKFLKPLSELKFSFLKLSLGILAIGAAMIPFAYGLSLLGNISWEKIATASISLISLIGTMSLASKFAKSGTSSLILLGAAMIPFAYGLSLLENISWEKIAATSAGLIGLIATLTIAGNFLTNPMALAGIAVMSLAIAAIGGSMMLLGKAAAMFNGVDPMNLLKVAGSMLALSLSILPLVPFAPFVGILSVAMAVLSLSLSKLSSSGLKLEPVNNFFKDFKSFIKEIEISRIMGLSGAIGALSLAMNAFAASGFGSSIVNAFSGIIRFFSREKSIIEQLKELNTLTNLSSIGYGVKELAEGMNMLAQIQAGAFAGFNEFPWDKIKEVSKELQDGATLQIIPVLNANSLNSQKLETTGASMNGSGQVIINNVTNSGGNISTTSVSNNNRNIRVAPSIETGSARGY